MDTLNTHCHTDIDPDVSQTLDIGHLRTILDAPARTPKAVRQQSLSIVEVEDAINNSAVRIHHQPQYDLYTGRILGVECLARIRLANGAVILPQHFIDTVENSRLAAPFAHEIASLACQQLQHIRCQGVHLPYVAINLSAEQLAADKDLAQSLTNLLHEHELCVDDLEIEITESQRLDTGSDAFETIHHLSAAGFRITLDDFGTGYSSISTLVDMPVSGLKLDRRLVSKLRRSDIARQAVQHLVKMGSALGLKVIAEGTQNVQEDISLSELGCRYGQGFGFCKPLPLDQIISFIKRPPVRR
ncbi:MAG: EAL domain-containing protein [Pseudomonadota bacterium]